MKLIDSIRFSANNKWLVVDRMGRVVNEFNTEEEAKRASAGLPFSGVKLAKGD